MAGVEYKRVKRVSCKICASPHKDAIDRLLKKGKSYNWIIAWAKKQEPSMFISLCTISKHRNQHLFSNKNQSVVPVPSEIPNSPPKLLVFEATKADIVASNISQSHVQSLSSFLDLIIDSVLKDLQSNDPNALKPTISEAIKAAEIKSKINDQNKFEKELIKLFMEVSAAHGYCG